MREHSVKAENPIYKMQRGQTEEMASAVLLTLLHVSTVLIFQDSFVVRRKYDSCLRCHPGQPGTVVTGGDTMHGVPFDMGTHKSLKIFLCRGVQ